MTKIYIENLPFEVNDKSLRERFEAYGIVNDAHIITDKATGKSRCFGFVEMLNDEDAEVAVKEWKSKGYDDVQLETIN